MKALERENRELRQANEILRKASGVFCPGGARPPVQVMKAFIDETPRSYGVEPICKVLQIAPSTYYLHAAREADPATAPPRVQRDDDAGDRRSGAVWDEQHARSTVPTRSGGSCIAKA